MRPLQATCHELRPLAEYADVIPSTRPGKRINRGTFWRWAQRGVRGVRLHTVVLGGGRYTCDAWVCEFIAKRSELSAPGLEEHGSTQSDDEARILRRFGVDEHGPGAA